MSVRGADLFTVPPGFKFQRDLPSGRHGRAAVFQDSSTGDLHVCKSIPKDDLPDEIPALRRRSALISKVTGGIFVGYSEILESPTTVTLIRPFLSATPISEPRTEWPSPDALFSAWKQIASLVTRLHRSGVSGFILNPNNVFIAGSTVLAVTDVVMPMSGDTDLTHSPSAFDVAFVAPELLRGDGARLSPESDFWSLGVLLCFLETQALPWASKNVFTMLQQVAQRRLSFARPVRRDVELVIRDLLEIEPADRRIVCDVNVAHAATDEMVFSGQTVVPSGRLAGTIGARPVAAQKGVGPSLTFTSLQSAARAMRKDGRSAPQPVVRTRQSGAMTGRDRPTMFLK